MKMIKKPVSILLSLIMIISLFTIVPFTANAADGVSYVLRWWDNDTLNEETKTRTDYKKLTEYARNENHTLTSGWYVANEDVQFRRLIINGDVHIIVPDGVTMKCRNIIVNYSQNTLNIYGQEYNTGKLEVTDGSNDDAAIGSYEDTGCGNIFIHGGDVFAQASDDAPGIGCGKNGRSGKITIYGGKVTAQGAAYGAGIGAGDSCRDSGYVYIYGGKVTATGGKRGAGIGGGNHSDGCSVVILGGKVTATGGEWGAGIGGGNKALGGTLVIGCDAQVTAKGGIGGAGVGGGDGACALPYHYVEFGLDFRIMDESELTAIGGDEAAGIGGGNQEDSVRGIIDIRGGKITATGGANYGAGIGGGDQQGYYTEYSGGFNVPHGYEILISGGFVTATGGKRAAGIGGGDKGNGSKLSITGGDVTATGGENAAGIGGGNGGNGGSVTINDNPIIKANGGANGAGIGGGNGGIGGTVAIDNGSIYATGGDYAAGIGGSNNSADFGNVTINDCTVVNAQGGKRGAGIGGGEKSTTGTVTINGGDEVNATGGIGGAGIGKGSTTTADTINVTINGGIVNATGGEGLFDKKQEISVNCAPAIGGASFSGTIDLKGGNIDATGVKDKHISESDSGNVTYNYGRGTAIGSNSSNPRTGTVNITAGAVVDTHINKESNVYSYHYHANAINFIDTDEGRSRVQYDSAYAAADDRVKACGWKADVIHIAPCTHGEFIYTKKDSEHHVTKCLYCNQTDEEPHNDVLTSWEWIKKSGNVYTGAVAHFTCSNCGNTVDVEATTFTADWGTNTYTATVVHNNENYSIVGTSDDDGHIVEAGAAITWENTDGTMLDSQVVPVGDVPVYSKPTSPVKPGVDSDKYTFVGWSDGKSNFFNGVDTLPTATTQTVYRPIYMYQEQTAPYIDASGAYIPGKERHYLIFNEYFEINGDNSVGLKLDSVEISNFDFELLHDNDKYYYRINKYTGPTDNLTELVIPKTYRDNPVTVVGDDYYESKLIGQGNPTFTLVLNENIEKIGNSAFYRLNVTKVTGDTSALKNIGPYAFLEAGGYALDFKFDYPGTITCGDFAFQNLNLTARVKHATKLGNAAGARNITYIFTDEHIVTPEWDWAEDYSSATATFNCTDTRCHLNETYDATVTSKVNGTTITYTATVEAMGETYTDTRTNDVYRVTMLDSAHGKVETNVQQAREGDQVTVTSVPDEGYHLGSVSVVKDTRVPLTYVMGGIGYENENGDKLVDGNKTTNWRQGEGNWTVIMKADSKVRMAGYSLTTGNTVADNPGSNWKKWIIYGGDFGSDTEIEGATDEGWKPIAEVDNDTALPAENNKTCDFSLSTPADEYQYYLIRVFYSQGADYIQMSEFELKTEEENVALTDGGFTMPAYPVIVSATFEPNKHTVTWLNEDGTELERDENVPYGSTPTFNGTTPTKTDCTFMGWKDGEDFYAPDELPEVTKDVTYTAVFGAGDGLGSELAGHSISLEGDIAVNFYMELSDFVIAHKETAYMRFAVPGENGATEQKEYVRDAKIKKVGDKTYYAFKCRVAAKEMTSEIKARLIDGSKAGDEYTYSVKQYADYLLSNASVNPDYEKAVPLVKKMLNYGAYAQLYFDRNADNLANKDLPDADKALGNVTVNAPQTDVSLPKGVSFEGSTLSLKSETTLSLYFTSNATLSFSAGDKTVETASSGNYQIARIRGIAASELKDSFTLTVTAGEETGRATYSPMNYCGKILNDGTDNEALSNVTKALVLYAQTANEYFSPTS